MKEDFLEYVRTNIDEYSIFYCIIKHHPLILQLSII